MKRTLALLLILALLSGCGGGTIPPPPEDSVSDPGSLSAPPDDEAVEPEEPEKPADPVEVLLKELSMEEKVGQLFFARCPAKNGAALAAEYHLGGYILFGRENEPADPAPVQALLGRCTARELRLAEKVLQLFLLRGDL